MPQRNIGWSILVDANDIPAEGRQFAFSAGEVERAEIARSLELPAISRLDVCFDVQRTGSGGLRITGTVAATVTQTCVVTLEPIVTNLNEAVDLVFAPAARVGPRVDVDTSFDAPDPPDPIPEGGIDLVAVAVEFLHLGMDPYPRKPDAEFEAPGSSEKAPSPFAVLASLKGTDP